jgi:hypothetical protein
MSRMDAVERLIDVESVVVVPNELAIVSVDIDAVQQLPDGIGSFG